MNKDNKMTQSKELDAIFEKSYAVKRLMDILQSELGFLVDACKLTELDTELNKAGLIGFEKDYGGMSRCYITDKGWNEIKERGL